LAVNPPFDRISLVEAQAVPPSSSTRTITGRTAGARACLLRGFASRTGPIIPSSLANNRLSGYLAYRSRAVFPMCLTTLCPAHCCYAPIRLKDAVRWASFSVRKTVHAKPGYCPRAPVRIKGVKVRASGRIHAKAHSPGLKVDLEPTAQHGIDKVLGSAGRQAG
jgi:hypothetical protein